MVEITCSAGSSGAPLLKREHLPACSWAPVGSSGVYLGSATPLCALPPAVRPYARPCARKRDHGVSRRLGAEAIESLDEAIGVGPTVTYKV